MTLQLDAIKRLFRDDDPGTVELVKEQLVLQGEVAVDGLRELVGEDSAIVAAHAQDVLHSIAGKHAAERLEAFFKDDSDLPLETSCWLMAEALMPWLDIADCIRIMDEWGGELQRRLVHEPGDRLFTMIHYVHQELGFDGNTEDYYNHENSLLPCVMENRRGLPLTLTLLYIFLGARAGIPIEGVNLPGHFIARCGETYFDPFHQGRILSIADCADILARQQIELTDEHLENPGSRQIIARLLANLRHAYHIEEATWQRGLLDRWFAILTGEES
jgi:regulator of sirC expression with transglutaminase-like and TPR domain